MEKDTKVFFFFNKKGNVKAELAKNTKVVCSCACVSGVSDLHTQVRSAEVVAVLVCLGSRVFTLKLTQ